MKTIPRRCGASLPKANADEGWYWCDQKHGHTGNHTDHSDGAVEWRDQDTVCVVSYDIVRAVSDHLHDFIGDDDECQESGCALTYGKSMAQQREWEAEQADSCSYCGHAQHCHTFELAEERYRDYCNECSGDDEYHTFDEKPDRIEAARERLVENVRAMLGSDVPRADLEGVVDRMLATMQELLSPAAPKAAPYADLCSVPDCGHWESQHDRHHCTVCHTTDPEDRKCQHYYFPPQKDKD